MFDTNVTIIGNVLTQPEWRRTQQSNQLVANFRIASTARRYDRENRCWVDGNSLRIRVSAWRRLAEGVIASISVGDPVVAYGRIYTRDWEDEEGNHRVSYEMEAHSVGHDLARGQSRFARTRPTGITTADDGETEADGLPEPVVGEMEPDFLQVVAGLTETAEEPEETGDEEQEEEKEETPAEPEPVPVAGVRRARRARREPVAA
ncbi:single-stranded DNA-binding protein [Actinoplanes sp. NPDC020271]|uniref:single-stranded DNA-binding protein n=1 Tax=Actinoplanes sp. NPDC020271 TaxID=3363896 RepID=UPI0037BD6174